MDGRKSGGIHLGRHRRHLRRHSENVPSATWRRPQDASHVVSAAPHRQYVWSARQPKLLQSPNPRSDESTRRTKSSWRTLNLRCRFSWKYGKQSATTKRDSPGDSRTRWCRSTMVHTFVKGMTRLFVRNYNYCGEGRYHHNCLYFQW